MPKHTESPTPKAPNASPAAHRCGYVALIGRPNAGKSTLLNAVLGQKVAIVTHKPQTTRDRLLAIHTTPQYQMIFLDTPGVHRPVGKLGRYMNEAAYGALREADVTVWLIDMHDRNRADGLTTPERALLQRIADRRNPVIAVLNKIDLLRDKQRMLPIMAELAAHNLGDCLLPLSAKTQDGLPVLLDEIQARLPEGPAVFPDDIVSDKADKYFVSELVREAITLQTDKEVPYKTAVVIDRYVEEQRRTVIHATIFVERDSQKGIMIGKGGQRLVQIGTAARAQIEAMLGTPVTLHLHVNVAPNWTADPAKLREMGYQ